MNEEIPLRRIYELRLLNVDLQKDQEDRLLVTDVRVSGSALEANQIFIDSEDTHKIFYNGQYFIREMPLEEFEELKEEGPHHHHHGSDDEDDE